MKLKDAVKHYGTQAKIAKILKVTETAVSNWGKRNGLVPIRQALRLRRKSKGAIDLRLSDYL